MNRICYSLYYSMTSTECPDCINCKINNMAYNLYETAQNTEDQQQIDNMTTILKKILQLHHNRSDMHYLLTMLTIECNSQVLHDLACYYKNNDFGSKRELEADNEYDPFEGRRVVFLEQQPNSSNSIKTEWEQIGQNFGQEEGIYNLAEGCFENVTEPIRYVK